MPILYRLVQDGGFVVGNTETGFTAHAHRASDHAKAAFENAAKVAHDLLSEEQEKRQPPLIGEYDSRNLAFLEAGKTDGSTKELVIGQKDQSNDQGIHIAPGFQSIDSLDTGLGKGNVTVADESLDEAPFVIPSANPAGDLTTRLIDGLETQLKAKEQAIDKNLPFLSYQQEHAERLDNFDKYEKAWDRPALKALDALDNGRMASGQRPIPGLQTRNDIPDTPQAEAAKDEDKHSLQHRAVNGFDEQLSRQPLDGERPISPTERMHRVVEARSRPALKALDALDNGRVVPRERSIPGLAPNRAEKLAAREATKARTNEPDPLARALGEAERQRSEQKPDAQDGRKREAERW